MVERVDDVEAQMRLQVEKMKIAGMKITNDTPLASREICLAFSSSCDWRRVTGFDLPTLEKIIMKAVVNFKGGATSKISDKEAILLAIIWLRSGLSFTKLAEPTKWNSQIVTRAVIKGISAVASCFEEFTLYEPLKPLVNIADAEDIKELTETELRSQFIVDGKHVPAGKIGREAERKSYYSYKLKHVGYQFQCTITHTDQCVHVSEGERAGSHDMSVYYNNRRRILIGLCQIAQGQPIIMADQGYVCADCPELIMSKSPVFNKYRILIERHFGRMTVVFGAVPKSFSLSYEHFNSYVRALCFLTNVHIMKSTVVNKDAKFHSAMEFMWQTRHDEKTKKHREPVRESRKRSLTSPESQCFSVGQDFSQSPLASSSKGSPDFV